MNLDFLKGILNEKKSSCLGSQNGCIPNPYIRPMLSALFM